MNYDDAPFYLAPNNFKDTGSFETKAWFKCGAVGVNKLNSLMKTMAAKAGMENSRLRNHSGRKTMVQRLCEQDVPPTQIAQLSGHKNLKSIENYSSVSTRQQMYMSNVLSSLVAQEPPPLLSKKLVLLPRVILLQVSMPCLYSVGQLFKVVIFL